MNSNESNIGTDIDSSNNEDLFTGIPSTYEDLYSTLIFGLLLFILGDVICKRLLRIVPSLVGYIITGIILGPEGYDIIPFVDTWVMLGNVGLTLLITQAGLEMDLQILKLIGIRGFVMAIIGSILPISIGMFVAWSILGQTGNTVIAIGCCFGPTSAGIAINVLGQCNNILDAPIGQLIVAAAIVDDILALLVLSQLQALTGDGGSSSSSDNETDINLSSIIIPIISAFSWLFIGGAIALFIAPQIIHQMFHIWIRLQNPSSFTSYIINAFRLHRKDPVIENSNNNDDEMWENYYYTKDRTGFTFISLLGLLFVLLPATYYTQASYLLGAFLTGLAFCQESSSSLTTQEEQQERENDDRNDDDDKTNQGDNENKNTNNNNNDDTKDNENNNNQNNNDNNADTLNEYFSIQLKRIIDTLMKIFFAATIGFQVPLSILFNDRIVIRNGFILSLSLLGKLAIGPLLTPIFDTNDDKDQDDEDDDDDEERDGGKENIHNKQGTRNDQQRKRTKKRRRKRKRWNGVHLRDCAVVGFSMAGEAEFAFIVAVFGVTEKLIPSDLYASIVLAILLSTILSPLFLRTTLAIYPYDTTSTTTSSNVKETKNKSSNDNDEMIDQNKDKYQNDVTRKREEEGSIIEA